MKVVSAADAKIRTSGTSWPGSRSDAEERPETVCLQRGDRQPDHRGRPVNRQSRVGSWADAGPSRTPARSGPVRLYLYVSNWGDRSVTAIDMTSGPPVGADLAWVLRPNEMAIGARRPAVRLLCRRQHRACDPDAGGWSDNEQATNATRREGPPAGCDALEIISTSLYDSSTGGIDPRWCGGFARWQKPFRGQRRQQRRDGGRPRRTPRCRVWWGSCRRVGIRRRCCPTGKKLFVANGKGLESAPSVPAKQRPITGQGRRDRIRRPAGHPQRAVCRSSTRPTRQSWPTTRKQVRANSPYTPETMKLSTSAQRLGDPLQGRRSLPDQTRALHHQGEPHLRPGVRRHDRRGGQTHRRRRSQNGDVRRAGHAQPARAGPAVRAVRPPVLQQRSVGRRPRLVRPGHGQRLQPAQLDHQLHQARPPARQRRNRSHAGREPVGRLQAGRHQLQVLRRRGRRRSPPPTAARGPATAIRRRSPAGSRILHAAGAAGAGSAAVHDHEPWRENHTKGVPRPASIHPAVACVASNDQAVGQIVDALASLSRFWATMAIFIIEDDSPERPRPRRCPPHARAGDQHPTSSRGVLDSAPITRR